MAFACLFYGLIVAVIGVVSLILPRKVGDSRVRESLWLLGTFGLLHAVRAWTQVIMVLQPDLFADKTLYLLDCVGFGLNFMALLCLAQFAAEIVAVVRARLAWMRWMPLTGFFVWMTVNVSPFVLHGGQAIP